MSNRNTLLSRNTLMSVALFAVGALSVLGYGYITKEDAGKAAPLAAARPHALALPAAAGAPAAPSDSASRAADGASANNEALASDAAPANNGTSVNRASSAQNEAAAAGGTAASAVTPEAVASWVEQANGTDPTKRSAAIDALANAPKAAAVPALAQVLETASEAERPRALRSLRTLAQRQGDEDDRIRSVVRKIVYHDGDENAVQIAQATLNDIEQDLSQATAAVKR